MRLLRWILRQTVCRFFGHSATTTNDRDPWGSPFYCRVCDKEDV